MRFLGRERRRGRERVSGVLVAIVVVVVVIRRWSR
jgi:hypothetical protein